MIIEMRGVNARNKGAELMLHAIAQKIERELPEAELVLGIGPGNFRLAKMLGIRTQLMIRKRWQDLRLPYIFFAGGFLKKRGYYHEKEVDVILDASGFAYGDQWSLGAINNLNRLLTRFKKKAGKTFIMLPQALGPFDKKFFSEAFKRSISDIDLICARDDVSFVEVEKLNSGKNIVKYPDFTNLVDVRKVSGFSEKVCIIPNYRMLDKTSVGDSYVSFLVNLVRHLKKYNLPFYFLIHDTGNDMDIVDTIKKTTKVDIEIVSGLDALGVKSHIASSRLVVSSRFHGIVSALSSGIPCIATGWSHKYEELMRSYGVEELLIKDFDLVDIRQQLEQAEFAKAIIVRKSSELKVQSEKMWDMVVSELRKAI